MAAWVAPCLGVSVSSYRENEEKKMKKSLVLTVCLLLACPSLSLGGNLVASGQAYVFAIFGAPPPATLTWFESNGVTKLGEGWVTGPNPVGTYFSGKFVFNLTANSLILRFNTFIQGEATYLNGFLHVWGNSAPFTVMAGPSQTTTINGIVVHMW
jgi:hypothetical protein